MGAVPACRRESMSWGGEGERDNDSFVGPVDLRRCEPGEVVGFLAPDGLDRLPSRDLREGRRVLLGVAEGQLETAVRSGRNDRRQRLELAADRGQTPERLQGV